MASMKVKDGKINFRCKAENCKHSCCGPFEGISKELCNIDQRPFDEIVLTEEDYEQMRLHGRLDLVEQGYSQVMQKPYYKMALEADGTCKAWKDGRCAIHDFSPTLCQAFPFYYDIFSGLCAIECEGFSDDVWTDLSDYDRFIGKAGKMYEFWLAFYAKNQPQRAEDGNEE